jgi:hypothetical protein
MVDLGFLLITFFFVSTTWNRPGAVRFFIPAKGSPTLVPAKASLTIFPLQGNQVFYYFGNMQEAMAANQFGICNYSLNSGIGEIIRQRQSALKQNQLANNGSKQLMVMIKPNAETSYNNLVKILDEMLINQVSKYAFMDLGEEEKQLLIQKKLME